MPHKSTPQCMQPLHLPTVEEVKDMVVVKDLLNSVRPTLQRFKNDC